MTRLLFVVFLATVSAYGVKIRDLATIKGVRSNQLVGYGVVVGLSGTGDKELNLTKNSLNLALRGLGVEQKPSDLDAKNVASVVVSATLPPFAKVGSYLDVTISSVGSASSLDGGVLLLTPLKGADGKTYAVAQGKVMTISRGKKQSDITGQSLVTATIPNGAIVEKEVEFNLMKQKELTFQLHTNDFTTSSRIALRINEELKGNYSAARDGAHVVVLVPQNYISNIVDLISLIENLDVVPNQKAVVVINQRTGTVVLGSEVKILPVAIAHNNLKLEIRDLASSESDEQKSKEEKIMMLENGSTIADVVSALNSFGASADDLVTMIQSLKTAGALMADVIVQ